MQNVLVSHADCGREHEVRSRVQCGGETGVCLFLSADCSGSPAVHVVTSELFTSGKDVIHPEEGGMTLRVWEDIVLQLKSPREQCWK